MNIAIVGSGIAGLAAAVRARRSRTTSRCSRPRRAPAATSTRSTSTASRSTWASSSTIASATRSSPRCCASSTSRRGRRRCRSRSPTASSSGAAARCPRCSRIAARLASPRHWRFLVEVVRFLARAQRDLGSVAGRRDARSTSTSRRAVPRATLRDHFAIPLAAALWSTRAGSLRRVPGDHATSRSSISTACCRRGSRCRGTRSSAAAGATSTRCSRSSRRDRAGSRSSSPRRSQTIVRDATGVTLLASGRERRFDRVIVATHADTALALLAEPSADERAALGAFRYSANRTVLHTDRTFLPARRGRARVVELRRRSGHRARQRHVLDDAPAGPARSRRTSSRSTRGANRAACSTRSSSTHPQFDRAALAARAAARADRRHAPHVLSPVRTSASAFTRTACAPARAAAMRLVADLETSRIARRA